MALCEMKEDWNAIAQSWMLDHTEKLTKTVLERDTTKKEMSLAKPRDLSEQDRKQLIEI